MCQILDYGKYSFILWQRNSGKGVCLGNGTEIVLTDVSCGLSQEDAEKRLAQFGKNEIIVASGNPALKLFLRQFKSLMVYVLLFAALV